MAAQFTELDTPKGQGKLNGFLSDKSYVSGFEPSNEDLELLKKFSEAPPAKFAHLRRWFDHIQSFSEEERAAFAAGEASKEAPAAAAAAEGGDDDDDFDLFGSDDEDDAEHLAEIERRAQEQLAAKAAKGKVNIAKSTIVFDVKPWEMDTDMAAMEKSVRDITMDGLVWGASELKDVAFGVKKLVIMCTIVDDLVSSDDLQEAIEAFDDYVQSVDIAAFNKV
mmetsp:Transcript_7503/g.8521  ORF Transcript_7503/g.8521 Transcript_7503/m.8521 type:complete len:222 (+) Transcript_7503:40-705(+)|eukprot:CAMPEP_0205824272 /NCGR_PEP_ID=MMETSP0206-20130828/20262_1 /ASSEMBLY_ACC=CAM_ASM_000279 /TAXON_ID=36767 /ORGANISM="Euplotes focardii, Strain TN1" /LENGTH=221 /DNA_ID=CAMNT_0053122233 /DNA_START=35 /DNA_END=700 /DNA_ORIENTATION=+